jgi:hypothetical protein
VTIPFPFTAVLDNFNRANVGPPASANWNDSIRPAGGTPALSGPDAGLKVVSNALQGAKDVSLGGNMTSSGYWKTAFSKNHEVYVTLGAAYVPAGGAPPTWTGYTELYARGTGWGTTTYTAYTLEWRPDLGYLALGKVSNTNTNGTLIRSTMPVALVAGDSIGLRVYGSTQEAWYKKAAGAWTLLGSAGDTALPSGGLIGLSLLDSARNLDDFGGGSIPLELLHSGLIAPSSTLRRAITVAPANSPKGTLSPAGSVARALPKTTVANVPMLGTLALSTGVAPAVPPQAAFPLGMEEEQVAVLPWPDGQRMLQYPGRDGLAIPATCGWHGTAFDPQRGAFGIVSVDGPLADMVGERLVVTRRDVSPARTVYVYVHSDSETLTEELSLSRRAFMGLGDPALDRVQVTVDTVSAAVLV